ncbi:MAG: hypothetical protein KDK62_07170 [Chlamydiia bacterium]|nr:hypothetical protein [Chlamydiia bacterium]
MVEKRAQTQALKSFEEVYQTSYSHGLESIYRLENVDLKSIRKLGGEEISPTKVNPKTLAQQEESSVLELDLGPEFSGYLSSFVLEEPIQTLKLARHIEKTLLDQGVETLKELSSPDLQNLPFIKGLGKGHLHEIQVRVEEKLREKDALKPRSIDILSWIRGLVGDLETKKAWALLEPFGLQEAIALSPIESVEIKKLTEERKRDFIEQAQEKVKSPDRVHKVRNRLFEIETVFLRPWLKQRGGVATQKEVHERLQLISKQPELLEGFLNFLKAYLISEAMFQMPQKEGLFFSNAEEYGEFFLLENRVLGYLWNSEAKVRYDDLVKWISRDLALTWKALSSILLKKTLAFSTKIQREKSPDGEIYIKKKMSYIQ